MSWEWQAMGLMLRRAERAKGLGSKASDDPIVDSLGLAEIGAQASPTCERCGTGFLRRPDGDSMLCRRCAGQYIPKNCIKPLRYPRKAER
jgi:hypothetical protein